VNCCDYVLICCISIVTLPAMQQRGQASVEWVGVVALVAVVMASVAAFALPTGIGPAVVRQIHRALCIVSGGVCDLDQRPCVTAANATEDEAHVNLGILRLGRHELILREHQSDGSILVTYLHDTGAGWELGAGADVSIGKRLGGMSATARAAMIASLGGGETWLFADARAADRGMAFLSEGKSPPGAKRAQRITQRGVQFSADASGSSGKTAGAALHLDARFVDGTVVDDRDGRRTHVITHRGEAGAIVKVSEDSGAAGSASGEERIAVTTDARGRPLELVVVRTGELQGALSLPDDVQPIAGALLGSTNGHRRWVVEQRLDLTDPGNRAAVQGMLDALDGPLGALTRADDALRRQLKARGVTEARTYDVAAEDGGGWGGHIAEGLKVGGGVSDMAERATLVDARVLGPDGEWRRRTECLARA
jgi:hypothetical protein